MKQSVVSGIIGGLLVVAILLVVFICGGKFDYRAIVLVDQTVLQDTVMTEISAPEYELMNSLREKNVLITPSEYMNNLVGYYDTLIAFLAIFFVVFTFVGYFCVKSMSKKEVREEAREILKDSESFRNDVLNVIRIEFDGNYVAKENYENEYSDMSDKMSQLLDDIERLKHSEGKSTDGNVGTKRNKANKS